MRNNKKVLKVTTSLLSGIFLASSITGNIYANNKVSFVEIMPNNEDIYFAVEEKGEDLVNIKLSAKKDVENISLKFMIDNKQYFYNYKSLKKDQEISFDVNPKELAKKILPVTSVVRKTEEINAVVGSHIIKGTISYSVDEENKEDKVTPEVNKEETKPDKAPPELEKEETKPDKDKATSEVNKEEGKETSESEKEETAPDKDKETSELEKEDTVTPEVNKEENEKPKSEDDTKNKDEVEVKFNDINLKNFILEKLHNYDGNDEFEEDMNEYNFKLIDKNYRKDKSSDKIYKSDLEKIESLAIRGWDNEFEVNDLTGIENMVNLKTLTISSNNTESPNAPTAIKNLEPLKNLSKLELLRLSHNAISDLTPLRGLNLKKLYLSHNMIENIEPLSSLESLEDLDLAKNSISDYSAVLKLHNLKSLNIRNNKVTSLEPIKDLENLKFLMANDNKITDISPLAKMTDLEYLYIDNNLISDFSILKNSDKLKHLLYNNQNIELGSSITTNKKEFTIDIPYKGLEGISKDKISIKAIVNNSSENKELDGITVDYDSSNNKLHFTLSDELFNNEEIKNLKFDLEITPTNKYEYFGEYTTEPVYVRNINLSIEEAKEELDLISIVVNKGVEPLANSDVRLIKKENNIPNVYGTFKTNDKGMLKFDKLEKNSEYEIWMANTTYKYDKDFVTVVTDDIGNIKSVDGALATPENTTIEFTAHEKQEVSDSIRKVTFKVVNKETGLPEENVQLTANTIHPKLASYKHVKSDKDGNVTFELEGTEEGKIYTICISKNYQFLYDFEPEEITIVVTNKDKDVVLKNANEAIFKVTKNDRLYLKENLKNKIKEAEEFIAKNPKLDTQKLQQLVDKSKEELEKETIPLYVEGYTKQITDKLNELKNTSETPLENAPIIYHVKDANKTLEAGNSEFTTRVFGKNLTDDLKIFVKEIVDNKEIDSTDVTLKEVSGEKSGFKDVVLVSKENKTNADKVYKVYYGYGENASSISSEIIVKPYVSNEVTKVVIPTILLNYNNGLVSEPVTFKIMEKDGGKFKEVTSEMSMLTEIEVEKNKEYTISLKANNKYTMVPLSFVVDNNDGEPKIVGSNDTLVQLDLSKKILTPIINDYTINNNILNSSGGKVTVEITGENLKHSDYGTRVRVIDIDTSAENSEITKGIVYREEGNRLFADINFPGNTSNKTKSYSLTIYSNLNQVFNKSGNRSQRAVISVLPANASNTDTTLSNLTINSYATNSTGALSDGVNPKHTVTATNQESKKTEVKLYGTNLKESVTKIRIFDTNGVEWPIFVAGSTLSGIYPKMILPGTSGIGNGIVGNGNFQLLEVILPNELSTDMTYSYYISIDGSGNLVEDNKVTATVKAGSATSEKVNPEKRTITIKYQDEHGRKLKDDKTIVGYSWFDYTVEKDNIENYSFKNVKDNLNLTGKFGTEDKEIILVYGDKTSVVDENLATAEDKEKLSNIKNTKPTDIPNFREASEELRRLHALARLEATELLAKDNATKEEVNNLINKLQDIRNKIEKSGKVESNEPTVENSGVATEETAEKGIEFYKEELRKIAVILSKIDNYSDAEETLKLEYTQKRKEALKKLGNNEFTLEEIKATIEELKVLKGKIENPN